jgi:hypothetical protein
MKKLKEGDYVKDLTKRQFKGLLFIEGSDRSLSWQISKMNTDNFMPKSVVWNLGEVEHSNKSKVKKLLSFDEFKQRLINTMAR